MGLFDFIKSAGKKLGIGSDDEDKAPPAEEIKKELETLDIGADNVDVEVDGDKVVLKGEVANQTILEKAIVAVGNTIGVAKVETQVKVAEGEEGEPVIHIVQKGESLWKIAEEHYGDGSKYMVIFEANRPMLSDPDKIYPGQALRIPKNS